MPDFRQKRRVTRLLRDPSLMKKHAANIISGADARYQEMINQLISIRLAMLSPAQVRELSREVYRDEALRLDTLRDDATRLLNEIASLHPAYRKRLNQAIARAIHQ